MSKKKVIKKYALKDWVFILLFALSIVLFTFSMYKIVFYYISSKNINKVMEVIDTTTETTEYISNDASNVEIINPPSEENKEEEKTGDYWDFINTPFLNVDFTELKKRNSDTVAWIKINNTNINYPVVQGSNNDYYLTRAFDESWNSAGWIFMDHTNDAENWNTNTVIYGHSMLNTTMFGTLYKTYYSSWYNNKNNQVIQISTPKENTLWQVFSIYKIEAEGYYITTEFSSDKSKETFFKTMKERSIKDFGVELNSNDKILTLSTCTSATGNGRLVVQAKLIKRENRG